MPDGLVPQRDENGDENGDEDWDVMRVDLDSHVPNRPLDDAPTWRPAPMPRRYARYPGLEGRDVVDFLRDNGISVGAHDVATAEWAAELDPSRLLTVLSWVLRASAAGSEGPSTA